MATFVKGSHGRPESWQDQVFLGVWLAIMQAPLFMSVIQTLGRFSITIDDGQAVIFTGIGSFGLSQQFATRELTEVVLGGTRNGKGYVRQSIIVKAGKMIDLVMLAALLADDQCAFVAAAIVLFVTDQEQQGTTHSFDPSRRR